MGFLTDLSAHNERDWFQDNKPRYEEALVEPALAFIADMEPRLHEISRYFTAIPAKQGGSLMRIYRDTRFGNNKSPYKTNIGIHFRHELAKDVHAPGFYVHIQPDGAPGDYGTTGSMLGIGVWRPDGPALKMIRDRIAERPGDWLAARDDAGFKKVFTLEGDTLKRPPRGYDPEHECLDDLKRKDFVGSRSLKASAVAKKSFVDQAAKAFEASTPMMGFLCKALGVPY